MTKNQSNNLSKNRPVDHALACKDLIKFASNILFSQAKAWATIFRVAKFSIFVVALLGFFGITNFAFSENNSLPEPMVGVLTIEQSGSTQYGGYTGNEAVFNSNQNELLGFSSTGLMNCFNSGIEMIAPYCYSLDRVNSIKIMTSRTFVNGMPDNEVATLLWPANSIVGDAYTTNNNLNNFAFYGRNINQSQSTLSGSDYTWGNGGYAINTEAQSSYSGDQKKYLDDRITQLSGEGQIIPVATLINLSGPSWNLQSGNIDQSATDSEINSVKDGKVWTVNDDVVLSSPKKYYGKGTIIINGNLTLSAGVNILPNSNSDYLGIIVNSVLVNGVPVNKNFTLSGKNKIQMANFTSGNIVIGASFVDATGSYVAKNFNITGNGVRFYYDFRLDSGWPPGFRYFNMPTVKGVTP